MAKAKPPCKDCEFRTIGCHSVCDRWKEYEIIKNAEYALQKEKRENNGYYATAGKKRTILQWFQYVKKKRGM